MALKPLLRLQNIDCDNFCSSCEYSAVRGSRNGGIVYSVKVLGCTEAAQISLLEWGVSLV